MAREKRARLKAKVNERGLARLEDRFGELPEDGERFVDPEHPYSSDLDLFGKSSLFQLLDATTTRHGEETLARWLRGPAPIDEAVRRQEAVKELAGQLDLRQQMEVEGRLLAAQKPDPARLLAWAEGASTFASPAWRIVAFALPAWTLAAFFASRADLVSPVAWVLPLLLEVLLTLATARGVASVWRRVSSPGEKLLSFEDLFAAVEKLDPQCPRLRSLFERLKVEGAPPSTQMRRLGRILGYLAAREQPLFHLPLNVILLWDLHFAHALERWRASSGPKLRGWFEALGELESFSSFAGFSYENPGYAFASLEAGAARLNACGLGHPLLSAKARVVNDVLLPAPGSVLLVTGSNMAGKTTLLRTLGVNAVLALAGAPVCARSLSLTLLSVTTSMRVQDSLARGLSFFYAELQRLKGVLDRCQAQPSLFLLAEVLQGTNTAERQAASRAIVKKLVEIGALGAIATHDVALTALEAETAGKVRNVHFTDRIENGEMTFDYLLKDGVVSTTNALELLKRVGIDIVTGR